MLKKYPFVFFDAFFFFFEDWNITFSFLKTSCKLLLSTNFLRWMQSYVSIIIFFFLLNVFLLTIWRGLQPFWLQLKTWNCIKELLGLEFGRNQNKGISILTQTRINHDQIPYIRNNWLGSKFFSLGDSHTKGCLCCFIWDLKIDTDPKERFASFKFTPSNYRNLCVYAPSKYSTWKQMLWKIKLYGKQK